MTTALGSFLIALAFAAETATMLAVPYLPQTPALCGGAAAAMVFRYWGDRHADVQQFAQYVDRKAGGIADDVLVAAVRERHWRAERIAGSVERIRDRLAAGEPVILLLDDRPTRARRFHYVVAVGADESHIYVHDPTWGPSRRYTDDELVPRWKASGFWSLVVRPGVPRDGADVASRVPDVGPSFSSGATSERVAPELKLGPTARAASVRLRSECDRLLDEAIDEIGRRGLSTADDLLRDVRVRCPQSAAPVAELAGVRFAERRLAEAEALAREAVKKDPSQTYAWDVLGSARFMRDDALGALDAWNHIGKPRLDSIQIEGLTRTRYALVAESLRLSPNRVLTESAYRSAERRLRQLPSGLTTAIRYRPEEDGFATVNVVIVERPLRPAGPAEWLATAARAMADRELRATLPGWTGQGEAWSASWRWWQQRPRLAVSFAAPRALMLPGVTRVEVSWEKQTYQARGSHSVVSETELHGGVAFTDWPTASLRYELGASVDSWDRTRRTLSVGGELEQLLLDDHVSVTARSHVWRPISSGASFQSGSLEAAIRSSPERRGFVQTIDFGIDIASRDAPLALWSGAGDGHGRRPLLRAHPLLDDGVITGSTFGRRLTRLTAETTRWFERPALARIGVSGFVDLARATDGMSTATDARTHADIGTGLRVALAGSDGTLRLDYARGLRDRRKAFSVGWMITTLR